MLSSEPRRKRLEVERIGDVTVDKVFAIYGEEQEALQTF
jgi:hypothetical protein